MTLYLHAQLVQGGGREPEALVLHLLHVTQLLVLVPLVAHTIVSLTGDPEGLVLPVRQTGEDPLVQEEHVVLKTSHEVAGQDVLVVPETIKIKIVRYNNRSERQGKTRTKRRTRTRRENQIIRESERESEREIQYPACRSASCTLSNRMGEGASERGTWALAPLKSREATETAILTPGTTHQTRQSEIINKHK